MMIKMILTIHHIWFLLTGVALGAGWQSTVAYVNLACYYIVGIPVGVVLGYVFKMQVQVSYFFFYYFFFYSSHLLVITKFIVK